MQTNDPDNDLHSLPSFSLSDDERAFRPNTPTAKNHQQTQTANTHKTKRSWKLTGLLFTLIAILGFGASWKIDIMQKQLDRATSQRQQLISQMDQITNAMTSNDQSTVKVTQSFKDKLSALEKEQTSLQKQVRDSTDQQLKTSKTVDENIANLRWRNKLDTKAQEKTDENISALTKKITALNSQLKNLHASQLSGAAQWELQISQLKDQVNSAARDPYKDKITAINKQLTGYGTSIKAVETTLKSIDEYRLQINRRLLQLEGSIRDLQQNTDKDKHDGVVKQQPD